jgi:hypothetical protein
MIPDLTGYGKIWPDQTRYYEMLPDPTGTLGGGGGRGGVGWGGVVVLSTYFHGDETGFVCLPTQLERTLQLYW